MPSEDLRLRKRCQALVDGLDLPRPLSVDALCRYLEERRSRPLHLHALPPEAAASGACGVWLSTATDDHIFYEQRTARLHQEHIVLHELGHLLFDHRTVDLDDAAGRSMLLPDLDPRTAQRFLARTNYSTYQEREAEMLASVLGARVSRPGPRRPGGVLGKLEAALGLDQPHGAP
ncbi:hypothetical protein PUR71_14835 [Streptomyces sp. SP17BM10]|uniref:hypothetical protein n=1 Tax=Streptomyces sp. SP17BM10 TaxID=3002530 RepID=UPI002E78164A|nr:hypothetical protein [Streptomyces sp. SP17BM10]MEE1784163.1 hypothetical protein [Streptomyces sp. SP17BM10]